MSQSKRCKCCCMNVFHQMKGFFHHTWYMLVFFRMAFSNINIMSDSIENLYNNIMCLALQL